MNKIIYKLLMLASFTVFSQSPGNISSDIRLWLKADTGTNTTTDGGGITSWNDQSGNSFNATGTGAAVYSVNDEFNYNPVISFTNDQRPISGTINRPNGVGSTVFVIGSAAFNNPRRAIFEFGVEGAGGIPNSASRQMFFNNQYGTATSFQNDVNIGQKTLWSIFDEGGQNTYTINQNNNLLITGNKTSTSFNSSWTSGFYFFGDDATGGDQFTGEIAEIVYYDSELSVADARKVESYLAFKYGLTLDNSLGGENGDYVLSDNTTVWDASTNAAYQNRIIGIGKDDDSDLEQIRSTDTEGILTLDKTTSFATDLDFIAIGDDGNAFSLSAGNTPTGIISKSERTWRVATNGTPGLISVSFELGNGIVNTTVPSDYELIIDNDTDFTDATTLSTGVTIVGNTLTFSNVSLSNGDFLALGVGSLTSSPGSVSTGIISWFKADAGTGTTVDGAVITQWSNSASSNHAMQAGTSDFATYAETKHNFNPSVYFANGDNGYFDVDLSGIKDSDYNIIAVVERDNSNDDNFFIGTNSTATNESLRLGYSTNTAVQFNQEGTRVTAVTDGFVSDAEEQPSLFRGTLDNGVEQRISFLNRGSESVVSDVLDSDFLTGSAGGFLGRGNTSFRGFEGYISELIVYNSALLDEEISRIESYLAVKYALTLDNFGGGDNGDYLDGLGNVIWDASANATYHNEIIAVGRDDNSFLDQQKSSEPISSTILTIDKGESFTSNQSFIVVGNNDATIGLTTSGVPTTYTNRIERTWKAQVSGTPGSVNFSITLGGAITETGNAFDYALLIDTDTDFSDATIHTAGASLDGNVLTFTNVDLPNNAIFTLAVGSSLTAPGDVIGNLSLWLKADAGTSTTVDGGSLTSWFDQSGSSANATGTGAQYKQDGFNNNPSIEFFDTDQPLSGPINRANGTASTVFTVYKKNAIVDDSFFEFGTTNKRQYFFDRRYAANTIFAVNINQPTIVSIEDPGEKDPAILYQNGGGAINTGSKAFDGTSFNSGTYFIGDDRTGGNELTGEIAEVLYYDRELTAAERRKVESYLALKYGITLDNSAGTTAGDYVLSDDSILWDASENSIYHNDVFAVVRDEDSTLSQLKSRSENPDSFIEVEKIGVFSNDLDFIALGNNNGSLTPTETDAHPSYSTRLDRTWLSQLGGTPGAVNLSFYLDELFVPNSGDVLDYALLIDNDTDFTSGATVHTTGANISDGVLTFTNVSLANNNYITLAINNPIVPFPGAIANNITLWLKADVGTNATTNGTGITSWIDLSGNGASATGTGRAVYNTSAPINYNPTISFTDDVRPISGSVTRTSGTGSTMFVVANLEDVVTRQAVFEFDGGATQGSDRQMFYTDEYSSNVTTGISKGISNLYAIQDTNGTSSVNIYENNNLVGSGNIGTFNSVWTTANYFIGDDVTGGDRLTGEISEIIYYDEVLSTADRQKVESYLAIKYGITLDNSLGGTSGDYIDSQGNTIWDASANVTYHNDIAIIGQDESSGLSQKQSRSESADGILTIALGNSIAASNLDNANDFDDDLDFLAFGHNGTDDIISLIDNGVASGTCPTVAKKLDRDWKVVNVGSVGTVSLSFDISTLPDPNDYSLVIDNDGDFGSGIIETNSSGVLSGDNLVFSGITNLTDGVVFTLIKNTPTAQILFANGVWSGGAGTNDIPTTADSAKSIEIRDDVTLTANFECSCLSVNLGAILTVPTTNYIDISGDLTLNGSIYLEGDAELVQTDLTNTNSGSGQIFKIIDDATASEYRYNYFASPVNTSGSFTLSDNLKFNTGVTLGDNTNPSFTRSLEGFGTSISTRWTHTLNNGGSFLEIDEDETMAPGVGFTMKGTGVANQYNFIGSPNNGNINVPITTGNFLLTGNPYASTIDLEKFNDLNSSTLEGIVYLWDQPSGDVHATGVEDDLGGYATFMGGVGSGVGVSAATLDMTDADFSENGPNSGNNQPSGFAKPGQGFVVYATATGNVQFDNSLRDGVSFNGSRHFFKANSLKTLTSIIRLGFEYTKADGRIFHRQIATSLSGNSLEKEAGKDAFMFDYFPNDAFWVIPEDEDRYVITSVPYASDDLVLPLGVVVENDKEITFKLDGVENYNGEVYLYDEVLKTITNIKKESHKVTLPNGEYRDRFSIMFNNQGTLSNEFVDNKTKTLIRTDKNEIEVILEKGNIKSIELYSLSGGRMLNYSPRNSTNSATITTDVSSNFYIIKIITEIGTVTKKIYID
ncbi:hypothetical protein ACXGQW_02195 [Wenyingzhuangia sp. IMCC45533]